jgi:hypothetical protein
MLALNENSCLKQGYFRRRKEAIHQDSSNND